MSPGAGADAAGGSPPPGGGRNSASSEGRAHRLSPCSSKGPDAAPEGCALLTSSPRPPKTTSEYHPTGRGDTNVQCTALRPRKPPEARGTQAWLSLQAPGTGGPVDAAISDVRPPAATSCAARAADPAGSADVSGDHPPACCWAPRRRRGPGSLLSALRTLRGWLLAASTAPRWAAQF